MLYEARKSVQQSLDNTVTLQNQTLKFKIFLLYRDLKDKIKTSMKREWPQLYISKKIAPKRQNKREINK